MKHLQTLAFDFGASSGRAILGSFGGGRLAVETLHQFPNGPVSFHGRLYWDALRLLADMQEGIRKAAAHPASFASIGIDTWGVDYGLLDDRGELMGNPYHYRDSRTQGMFDAACARLPREELFNITGLAVQPFNTLFQLLSTRMQNPSMLERAASLLFMPDLMAYFLTGVTATEYSIASTSQLLDVRARTWSTALLRAMDLPSHLLPQIQPPGSVRGSLLQSVRDELSAPPVPVIAVTTHDTASAVVSVPLQTSREAYLSSGTWSLLGVETAHPVLDRGVMESNFTNEGGFGGTYRVLRNVMGLWLLQECKREWDQEGGTTTYEELVAGAEKSTPLQCLVDPDDSTFYSPGGMQQKIRQVAAASGQVAPATRGGMTRVILESLAMKYRWVVERLEELLGYRIEALVIVGGGVRNALLNQLTANVLGRPVRCGPSEATAVGNTLVQLHALGEIGGLSEMRDVVRASFPSPLYLPQNAELWEGAYRERFLPLVADASQT